MRAPLARAALAATLLAATPSPHRTPPPPVFELHRTAVAAHAAPAKVNPLFVLVIGSDVREGDPAAGRADSIHIVAVNTETARGTIIGIPRDSFVNIPGAGRSKINDSLVAGGPAKTVETVTSVTGIPIHYWALIDFSRFRELVDRLGGLDVDVPYPIADAAYSGAVFGPGPHHMNGRELLAFARVRYGIPGGDFGRTENQGRILLAALAKLRAEAREPLALMRWLRAFVDLVRSDVPVRELIQLGAFGSRIDPANMRNVIAPGRTGTAGAASVVFLDPGAQQIFRAVRDDGEL